MRVAKKQIINNYPNQFIPPSDLSENDVLGCVLGLHPVPSLTEVMFVCLLVMWGAHIRPLISALPGSLVSISGHDCQISGSMVILNNESDSVSRNKSP
jgi:hypothetical protein